VYVFNGKNGDRNILREADMEIKIAQLKIPGCMGSELLLSKDLRNV
jgi:hypothetical protein